MSHTVSVRVSRETQARLKWHAAAKGCTISDYIRGLITEHLNAQQTGSVDTPEPVALPEPFDELLRELGYTLATETTPDTGHEPAT